MENTSTLNYALQLHFQDHIYLAQFKDDLILLDTKKDKYTICSKQFSELLIRIIEEKEGELYVEAAWDTSYVRMEIVNRFFGTVHYRIKKEDEKFKITYKQVILMNDKINAVLDFYHL